MNQPVSCFTISGNVPSGESIQLAAITSSSAWDNANPIALNAKALFIHFYSAEDLFVVANQDANDPSVDGCLYPKNVIHLIPCKDRTYLHYKNATAPSIVVYITEFLGK